MANVFMTGFEWGTLYEMHYWTIGYVPTVVTDPVRSGNYALKIYSSPAGGVGVNLPGDKNEFYIQFAFYTDGQFGSLGDDLMYWYGLGGDKCIGKLALSEAGQIRLYTCAWSGGGYGGGPISTFTLRAQGLARLKTMTWYVIEVHVKADVNFGAISCRVDGVADCDYSGPSTQYTPGTIDSVKWFHWSMLLDDIVINDTSGSFNNSWPGCLKVVLLRPNDDGSSSGWTPSVAGHNYDCVNEVPYDPTQYIHTYGLNVVDSYGVENLPEEAGDVLIVRGDAWAFKDSGSDAQNRKLAFTIQPTSTVYDSADQELNLQYALTKCPFDYNPETNAIFTKEEVNNILAGIKSRS